YGRLSKLNKVGKFAYFGAALLQRAMKGEMFETRACIFANNFESTEDINPQKVERLLKEKNCYRWKKQEGVRIIMDAKEIVFSRNFSWGEYFKEAKQKVSNGFRDDPFLEIKGVGQKVRDFALSLFLDEYLAVDIHIKRILNRWRVVKSEDYDKVKEAAEAVARNAGLSMRELDRVLWHFGRSICDSKPKCGVCPIKGDCGAKW
ncbi:MAG: hypothetical protein N2234_07685, partial [Planctomycetota bacterium]|nr:hypothetical protein [Planctomycetota bacterium]